MVAHVNPIKKDLKKIKNNKKTPYGKVAVLRIVMSLFYFS